ALIDQSQHLGRPHSFPTRRSSDLRPQEKSRGKQETPTLAQYSRDLTQAARQSELDPVIGRDGEIQRIIQILSRRTKNNPVLIGRSEEHTSELQSRFDLVCRLLLEK